MKLSKIKTQPLKVKHDQVFLEFVEFMVAAWTKNWWLTLLITCIAILGIVDEVVLFTKGWGLTYKVFNGVVTLFNALTNAVKSTGLF